MVEGSRVNSLGYSYSLFGTACHWWLLCYCTPVWSANSESTMRAIERMRDLILTFCAIRRLPVVRLCYKVSPRWPTVKVPMLPASCTHLALRSARMASSKINSKIRLTFSTKNDLKRVMRPYDVESLVWETSDLVFYSCLRILVSQTHTLAICTEFNNLIFAHISVQVRQKLLALQGSWMFKIFNIVNSISWTLSWR